MKQLFHKLANEGEVITALRKEYAQRGIYHSATRIELIIMIREIKAKFLSSSNKRNYNS